LDTALTEAQEKGGGVTPPPQTRLLKKLGGWIFAPELQMAFLPRGNRLADRQGPRCPQRS
jgi:hypothetical protein